MRAGHANLHALRSAAIARRSRPSQVAHTNPQTWHHQYWTSRSTSLTWIGRTLSGQWQFSQGTARPSADSGASCIDIWQSSLEVAQISRIGCADQSGCLHFRTGEPTEVLQYYVDLNLDTARRVQPCDKPALKIHELTRQPACTVGGRVRCASRGVDGRWYAQVYIHTHLPHVPARGSRTRWASGAGTPVHMCDL